MTKQELRKIYKDKRLTLSPKERMKLDDLLLIQFQRLSFEGVHVLMNYMPLEEKGELDTHLFSRYLQHLIPGLVLCYPVVDVAASGMTAIIVDDDTEYQLNAYGIAEPANGETIEPGEIDMVFVPLLACVIKC